MQFIEELQSCDSGQKRYHKDTCSPSLFFDKLMIAKIRIYGSKNIEIIKKQKD